MKTGWMLAAMLLSGLAAAKDNEVRGRDTHAWLAKQKAPASQAPVRGLPGEAADRVYQRYLQSFSRPIPERFERDKTGADSSK